MRRDINLDALEIHLTRSELCGQGVQRLLRPGDGGEVGRIDAGNIEIIADQRLYLGQR